MKLSAPKPCTQLLLLSLLLATRAPLTWAESNPDSDASPDSDAGPDLGYHGHGHGQYPPHLPNPAHKHGGYSSPTHAPSTYASSLPPLSPYPHAAYPQYGGYPKLEPIAYEESYPKQNCTVEDETLRAEICVPNFQQDCKMVKTSGRRISESEMCYDVTRTVCEQTETTSEVEVCGVDFEAVAQSGVAKSVQVEFKKECETQMVTVCNPAPAPYEPYEQPAYGGYGATPAPKKHHHYGSYQECHEVAQETCYNVPEIVTEEQTVSMSFPKMNMDCKVMTVTVPQVNCEDQIDTKCQMMPRIVEAGEEMENCEIMVGEPKCSEVELVLPKQVCKDIVYGYAKPKKYNKPTYDYPRPKYGHGRRPHHRHRPAVNAAEEGAPLTDHEHDVSAPPLPAYKPKYKPAPSYHHKQPSYHHQQQQQQQQPSYHPQPAGDVHYGPYDEAVDAGLDPVDDDDLGAPLQYDEILKEDTMDDRNDDSDDVVDDILDGIAPRADAANARIKRMRS